GKRYDSVTSVGGQPTFESSVFSVETLIIGFSGNLYDNIITVGFLNWMREMIKFNSKEALIEQISMDIEEAKNG
ncbi:MAG: riboflavin kinase, partial [Clostridia bacterium]